MCAIFCSFLACKKKNNSENSTPSISQQRPLKVVFYGDSFTAGFGLADDESYPSLIRARIDSLGLNWRVSNAAIAGETSAQGDERVQWVLQQGIDLFVLCLGYNDPLQGVSPTATYDHLQRIVEKVRAAAPDAPIVLIAPPLPPGHRDEYFPLYNRLAERESLIYIPNLTAPIEGRPEWYLGDGIHPNQQGIRILVEKNLWPVLLPLLRARESQSVEG